MKYDGYSKKFLSSFRLWYGVNFINILLSPFLYKNALLSFYLITVWLCNFFIERISLQKLLVKCWWNWTDDMHLSIPILLSDSIHFFHLMYSFSSDFIQTYSIWFEPKLSILYFTPSIPFVFKQRVSWIWTNSEMTL